MACLLFSPRAEPELPAGPSFVALVDALAERHPDSLFLPLSSAPPSDRVASPNVDWLTLPVLTSRAVQARLLERYASWFRPHVSVFFGAGVVPFVLGAGDRFGQLVVFSDEVVERDLLPGARVERLSQDAQSAALAVSPFLPATFVLGPELDVAAVLERWSRTSVPCELLLHCPARPSERELALVSHFAAGFDGKITLQVRLRQGVLEHPRAIPELTRLSRSQPRLALRVVSETSVGAAVAVTLSRALSSTPG